MDTRDDTADSTDRTQGHTAKERPILFSAPMVRAILAGAKTQTRRVVRWPATDDDGARVITSRETGERWPYARRGLNDTPVHCPYGAPGETLWVRESAYIAPPDFGDADLCSHIDGDGRPRMIGHAASMDADAVRCARDYGVKLTPSIHMPRWASRITLRVTSVRVERLHAITMEDILAEGVRVPVAHDGGAVLVRCTGSDPPAAFLDMRKPRTPEDYLRAEWAALWCEVNGRASWDANPWVWRVGFERVQP